MGSARLIIASSNRARDVKSCVEPFIACPPSVPLRPGHERQIAPRCLDVKSFCESSINFSLSVPFRPGHRGGQQQHTRAAGAANDGACVDGRDRRVRQHHHRLDREVHPGYDPLTHGECYSRERGLRAHHMEGFDENS